MAVVSAEIEEIRSYGDDGHVISWDLSDDDTGTAVQMIGSSDRSVQVEGSFGSGTVIIEGSNDGTNYRTLTDPQGNPLEMTTARIETVIEIVRWIRARMSGGSGSAVTVTLLMRRTR